MKLWELRLALERFTDDCEVKVVGVKQADFDVVPAGCRAIAFEINVSDVVDENRVEDLQEHLEARDATIEALKAQLAKSKPDSPSALRSACESALRVFRAWKHDDDPNSNRTVTADACKMIALIEKALDS